MRFRCCLEYCPKLFPTGVQNTWFEKTLGAKNVETHDPSLGGEDFGRYARSLEVPGFMFRLGTVDPEIYAASKRPNGPPLPSLHSSKFAPLPAPTLETGVRAMGHLALALLERK